MKRSLYIILLLAALSPAGSKAMAQNAYQGGVVVSAFDLGPLDMMSLSQHNTAFTTARASAMGGAFASLGGDLASMSINPAGIGMYRSSAFGFSPAMNFSGTDNSFSNGTTNRNNFAMNNVGLVITPYWGSGGLTAFNFGFSYNRLADFNSTYRVDLPQGSLSIADLMSYHLNGLYQYLGGNGWDGISQNVLRSDPFRNDALALGEWGAILGYQTGLVNSTDPGNGDWTLYGVDGLDYNAGIIPGMRVVDRGSVGEYNLTGGFNIENKFYLGVGLTFQDIYLSRDIYYHEDYVNNTGDASSGISYLKGVSYDQSVRMSGLGVNFKVGAIYRPIPSLRIGLAVHTPTWTTVTHEYFASMKTDYITERSIEKETLLNYYTMNYSSPTRLMAGVSYTIGDFAALSFDYERVWYNGMRVTGDEDYRVKEGYKNEVKSLFTASNNFKAGIEIKPVPSFAIRAGYSYYGTPLADSGSIFTKPVINETHNISAGLGFWLGANTTLDLAYIYSINDYCGFDVFYYEGELLKGDGTIGDTGSEPLTPEGGGITDLRLTRHSAIVSLTFLF